MGRSAARRVVCRSRSSRRADHEEALMNPVAGHPASREADRVKDFDPAMSFLGATAEHYDDAARGDEAETVALLGELAGGRALEPAIGSGRIALPLIAGGTRVDGIE